MSINRNADPMSGTGAVQHTHNALNYNRFGDPFHEVSGRLRGVIKRSNGALLAFCPAHDDRSRSLAVSVGRHGGVLMHCFAGCSVDDITGAIGLSPADLFVKNESHHINSQRNDEQARALHSMRTSLLLSRLPGIKHDLIRFLFVANSLHKNEALPADDREFVAELVIKINDGLSFVEGVK